MARRRKIRLGGQNEFVSSKILKVKLRRNSLHKDIAKQEIPMIDLANQAILQDTKRETSKPQKQEDKVFVDAYQA